MTHPRAYTDERLTVVGRTVYARVDRYALTGSRSGHHWRTLALKGELLGLVAARSASLYLTCVSVHRFGQCRPMVWRATGGHSIRHIDLPVHRTTGGVSFLGNFGDRVAVSVGSGTSRHAKRELLVSVDGGQQWREQAAPTGPARMCNVDGSFALLPVRASTWWYLCVGGAAAGSETKAVLETRDAGRTWRSRAAIIRLDRKPRHAHGLTYSDVVAFGGGGGPLWLLSVFGLQGSVNGGRTWNDVNSVRTATANGVFDVLSARRAWLLAPGRGLWQTVDGVHWRALGNLHGPD